MPAPLLATKLFVPPYRKERVVRSRLLERLDGGFKPSCRLILISAPAGFGKTTLVSEWVSSVHQPVTWLSLDRGDDDPGRFFAYLIAALQKVNENIGRAIESVLHSGQLPPLHILATSLINDILAAGVQFILVLDDFQVIQDQAILEVLEALLSNPPEQMHLVLITREDPLLPLARIRANNQMIEIRAMDLRFSEREVDQFLNGVMALSLSEADITAMENRTEGWAAGLQLAAIAMHGRADLSSFITHLRGSQRYILSYLTEEVLSCQSEDIQIFLLQTSILDKLCGELCDAVTRRTNSHTLLEKCFHANLFLNSLDDEGHWYRYLHLFQDLLRSQQTRFPKQDVFELHRRASLWYEKAGMIGESVEHALFAADYPHTVELLEDHALGMVMQGYLKTVEGWMQAIPSEWQTRNPRANLAFALMYLLRGNYDRVMPYLTQAEQAIAAIDPDDEAGKPLRAEWLAVQANLMNVQGKLDQGITLAEQALRWASASDFYVKSLAYGALGGGYRLTSNYAGSVEAYQLSIQNCRASGNIFPEMQSVTGLMMMSIQHGKLHFAYQVGLQALERLEREGAINSPIAGIVHGSLGPIYYEWNQLEKASGYLARGIQLGNLSGHNAVVVYAKTFLARVFQARGDPEAAAQTFQEVTDLLPLGLPAWIKPEVAASLVHYYIKQGNPTAAESVCKQLGIPIVGASFLHDPADVPDLITHRDGLQFIISLWFFLDQIRQSQRLDKVSQAIDLAGCLVARALPSQLIRIALQALLLRAQMAAIQGNMEISLNSMLQAIKLAESEGYVRTFVDEGLELAPLLKLAYDRSTQRTEPQTGFIQQLLASFPAPGPASSPGERHPRFVAINLGNNLIEPLTDREKDVLRLMVEGLKYQEIAERLVITLNTVRFYVKEIYSKLNVNNRTQAIETARKHHLL